MDDECDVWDDMADDMFDEPSDEEADNIYDLHDFSDDEADQYDFDQPLDEAVDELIASPPEEDRPKQHVRKEDESLKRNLPAHSHDAAELERREERLRTIFLKAAKYGLPELLEKALPVLRRMYDTRPKQTDRFLDFHDNRVSLQAKCMSFALHIGS